MVVLTQLLESPDVYKRQHLGKLESSGQLLLGIINNILDMSRIESGKPTLLSLIHI